MIEQTKALLDERHISRAAIIDDAFDTEPTPADIDQNKWNRFFDDVEAPIEEALRETYGAEAYESADVTELRQDPRFVNAVWTIRTSSVAATELFDEFEQLQERKRSDLLPLQTLLEGLGVGCQCLGRADAANGGEAQIIFLDLFLGPDAAGPNGDDSVRAAMEGVRAILAGRRATPPTVILMSANPRVEELGAQLRDDADLLGCQFRIVRKTELMDQGAMAERIYDLVSVYPDALKLSQYIAAWDAALKRGHQSFLRTIRTLDLADYANLQALSLEAEGARLGDYVIDLYDLHLHSVIESDEQLIRSAKTLNDIAVDTRAPGQFMPSAEVDVMMDGAMFHHEVRTRVEVEDAVAGDVHFGDILLVPPTSPNADGAATPGAGVEGLEVYVVISQPCDQQHGKVDRVILLRGVAYRYSRRQHGKAKAIQPRTPVMFLGQTKYMIEWNLLQPETWLMPELRRRITDEGLRVVRRFRTPHALALQQGFTSRLGRVGTLASPPARFVAGVKIYAKTQSNEALLVGETTAEEEQAVCLVGRTEKDLKEWLLISETLRAQLRSKLLETDKASLNAEVASARDDPAFYRVLKRGIEFTRGSSSRPFQGKPFDIINVVTSPRVSEGQAWPQGLKPLVIEIDAE